MSNGTEIRIQTAVLLVLLPTLFAVTATAGYLIYSSLYDDILLGFEEKLRSVSTVTASFLDPEEHARLLRPRRVTALAWDRASATLYGMEVGGALLVVDPVSGEADVVANTGRNGISDMSFDPEEGRLYLLDSRAGELLSMRPDAVRADVVGKLGGVVAGLARDPTTGELFGVGGGRLLAIDKRTAVARILSEPMDIPEVSAVEFGSEPGTLFAADGGAGVLIAIDIDRRSVAVVGAFRLEEPKDREADESDLAGGARGVPEERCAGLAFDPDSGRLWAACGRLAAVDPLAGGVRPFGYNGFRSESNPLYLKYVEPLRRIRERVDLTYLYTFVLGEDEREIVYVLDASTDGDHSSIGDVDSDPPDEGTIRIFREGGVHLSEIEYWEQWGLIKSADAAVYGPDGSVVAAAGADVNISIIGDKTRWALLKVCLVGVFCLGLASLAAVKVGDRLARPIEKLKTEALKVAAGQFGQQVRVESPAELRDLALSFNEMSAALDRTLDGLTRSNLELELERRRTELVLALSRWADRTLPAPGSPAVAGRLPGPPGSDPSGWCAESNPIYAWLIRAPAESAFEAVTERADLFTILRRLAARFEGDWERMNEVLRSLFRDRVEAFLCLDLDQSRCRFQARTRVSCLRWRGRDPISDFGLEGEGDFRLEPDEQVLFGHPELIVGRSGGAPPDGGSREGIEAWLKKSLDGVEGRDFLYVSMWRRT